MRGARSWLIPFAAALLLAGVVRACLPFDGLYGQDALAYFGYARALWPHLHGGAPLPTLYWPVGYPVVVALLLPLFGGSPAAGQLVSALACAGAAAATFALVRSLDRRPRDEHDDGDALVAALSVALSGATLRSSQVVMADALGLGAAAMALWCAAKLVETGRGHWLLGCALALGWGTITRWLIGLLAVPIVVFLPVGWRRGENHAKGDRRAKLWLWALGGLLLGAAVLVPELLIARAVPASLQKHEWLLAWNLRHAFGRVFDTAEGHAAYRFPVGVFYFIRLGWPDYYFPIAAGLAVAGGRRLLRGRRWPAVVLLIGWPAVAWLFVSGIPYENPRFLLPTLPCIGALAGIGFGAIRRSLSRGGRRVLVAACVLSLAAGLLAGAREHAHLVAKKNVDLDLIRWVGARVPAGATILMEGPTLAFQYYGALQARALFGLSDAERDALVAGGAPLFVLANLDEIEHRWNGLGPKRHVDTLRRVPGLRAIGVHPPYTLLGVGP